MKTIDELIYNWYQHYLNKEYKAADVIRDYLDTQHIFCFTTPEGYDVHHRKSGTRKDMIREIQTNIQAEKRFNAYLFTVRNSNSYKELYE